MRLLSIDELRANASAAFRRFPYTITAGLLSAVLVVAEAEHFDEVFGFLTRSGEGIDLLVATTLALPLMFALRVAEEHGALSRLGATAARVAGVLLLLVMVWNWPEWSEKSRFIRYAQVSLGLHLAAAVLPFRRAGELNGFWQYNRALFLRFITGAIFSVVLFGGLAIALAAIEQLFGVDIPGEPYMDLLAIVAFGFQTWFFTAGVPADLAALEREDTYPVVLKVFAQYVLIPLVTVYLAILTVYLGRIILTTEWPSGWIGWLVSSVSVAGILSILLTHPIRHRAENEWIVKYGRWFWLALLPSVAMLLVAIGKRIGQYGVTEPRYLLLVLTLWLAAMAVLYGFLRSQNIKWLPTTLAMLAFVTLVGPWGAYSVSRASQVSRLEGLLERNGFARETGGPRQGVADTIPLEDRRQIAATLEYLYAHHGSAALEGLLGPELAATDSVGSRSPVQEWIARDRAAVVMAELGIDWADPRPRRPRGQFHLRADPSEAVSVADYDWVFEAGRNTIVRLGERELNVEVRDQSVLLRAGDTLLVALSMADAVERGLAVEPEGPGERGQVSREVLRIEGRAGDLEIAFLPDWISGRRDDGELVLDGVNGLWLVRAARPFTAADSAAAMSGSDPP